MTVERSQALDRFFDEPIGRARTAPDAVAMTRDRLEAVEGSLSDVGMPADGIDLGQRAAVEGRVYEGAVDLGQAVIDGLTGMVISGAVDVDHVSPRRAGLEREAPPLDDDWQRTENPAKALAGKGAALREQLDRLAHQPNQLFRRLNEALALAADAAAWTAWTQLEKPECTS